MTSTLQEVFEREPINKTAALVVNQSGCTEGTELLKAMRALKDLTDCLISIDRKFAEGVTGKERKEMVLWKQDLQEKVRPLKEKIKLLKIQENSKRESNKNKEIIKECQRRFSQKEWQEILELAGSRVDAKRILNDGYEI